MCNMFDGVKHGVGGKKQKERGWGTGKSSGQKQGVGPGSYLYLLNSKNTREQKSARVDSRKSW